MKIHEWLNTYIWPFTRLSTLVKQNEEQLRKINTLKADIAVMQSFASVNMISLDKVFRDGPNMPLKMYQYQNPEIRMQENKIPNMIEASYVDTKVTVLQPHVLNYRTAINFITLSTLTPESKEEFRKHLSYEISASMGQYFAAEVKPKVYEMLNL